MPYRAPFVLLIMIVGMLAGREFLGMSGTQDEKAAATTRPRATIRVLSYNIRRGIGMDDKLDLERTAAFIKKLDCDFVALQEIDDRTRRSKGVNQAVRLGELTGMHAFFGKAMDYDGGGYGEAVLSKHSVESMRVHRLPAGARYEPRAMLEVRAAIGPNGPFVTFLGTHLDHEERKERQAQVEAIEAALAGRSDAAMILVGDFNDEPGSSPIEYLRKRWTDCGPANDPGTFPASRPVKKIDFIFSRGAHPATLRSIEVLEEPIVSDHRPVLAVFDL